NITANLPDLLTSLAAAQLTATPIALAALATIRAETESFEPISEFISQYNTSAGGQPFDLYDNMKQLGNQGPPDGANFKGRGYVQLTGRANYTKFGPIVGVDLVNNPGQANDPLIAAKKSAIATALANNDLAAARKLVNGGSNGLDRFSSAYTIGLGLVS
ncbi:MAG TPA: glycoside hydrolase family 19 protein, partial [Rhizomicrobium sp.]